MSDAIQIPRFNHPLLVRTRSGIEVVNWVHGIFHGMFTGNERSLNDDAPEGQPYGCGKA